MHKLLNIIHIYLYSSSNFNMNILANFISYKKDRIKLIDYGTSYPLSKKQSIYFITWK